MNKNLILSLSIICMLYFSCSKSKQPGPQNTGSSPITIALVSGSGQTDTVGQQLKNPIVVKVSQNGTPLSNYVVEFQGSGCNEDLLYKLPTGADGTVGFTWSLAGNIGSQTMKVFALDAQNNKVDSVTAIATAVATGPGWHFSACTPFATEVTSFCKLSSGRLFASFDESGLRYSDDNGISWNQVVPLASYRFDYVLSTPADGVFAFQHATGLYYSSDGGTTWVALNNPPFSSGDITSAICTPSGRLVVVTRTTVYISIDNGKTWTYTSSPNDTQLGSPAEDKNGNLYIVGQEEQVIFKSADNGATWSAVNPQGSEYDFAFYVDNNNWFYKSTSAPGSGGLYISKDNGSTYIQLISYPNTLVENISVQSDGNLYYDDVALGLNQAIGLSNQVKRIYDSSIQVPLPYIVAKNNNIVTLNNGFNLIAYYQK